MNKVDIVFEGWGQSWTLGTLAQRARTTLFEYSSEAIARGIDISPQHAKDVIDRMCEVARELPDALDVEGVRRATRQSIAAAVIANVRRCGVAV